MRRWFPDALVSWDLFVVLLPQVMSTSDYQECNTNQRSRLSGVHLSGFLLVVRSGRSSEGAIAANSPSLGFPIGFGLQAIYLLAYCTSVPQLLLAKLLIGAATSAQNSALQLYLSDISDESNKSRATAELKKWFLVLPQPQC